jgi:hypothetical protein
MDWELTFELKRIDLDGTETVEIYNEKHYGSKERWRCPKCQRFNYIAEDRDDLDFDPHVCESCGHREEELPIPEEDDAWWIICSHCREAIVAADFGQHLMRLHIHIPLETEKVGDEWI